MPDRNDAKEALDKVIKKSRVHLYKPIQIAEILYRDRKYGYRPMRFDDCIVINLYDGRL